MTKKTSEEEEVIYDNIDRVAGNLSNQVGELQSFLKKLRVTRLHRTARLEARQNQSEETPDG